MGEVYLMTWAVALIPLTLVISSVEDFSGLVCVPSTNGIKSKRVVAVDAGSLSIRTPGQTHCAEAAPNTLCPVVSVAGSQAVHEELYLKVNL